MLLHLFVMKSTTMGATRKDDFLKPEMTPEIDHCLVNVAGAGER